MTKAERIIADRGAKGMSQTELAEKAGISRQALSNIERGVTTPTPATWYRIAKVLEIELSEDDQRSERSLSELSATHAYRRGVLYEAIADIIGDNPTRFSNCSSNDASLMQALAMAGKAKQTKAQENRLMQAASDIRYLDDQSVGYTAIEQGQFQLGYYHARAKRLE